MTTYHDVKAKIAKLEDQARELLKKESAAVIAKIRSLMSEYGLTVQDLGLGITNVGKKMSAMKEPLPPKYRDPVRPTHASPPEPRVPHRWSAAG